MRKLKVAGLALFLAVAGVCAFYVSPAADASGIKNPFTCARDPKCVAVHPSMKKVIADAAVKADELRNPFTECELADPFRPDPLCDQVRAARTARALR